MVGQQGTIPYYQGGERVTLLGGLEHLLKIQSFKPIRFAVEAAAPIYQRLKRTPDKRILGTEHSDRLRILTMARYASQER